MSNEITPDCLERIMECMPPPSCASVRLYNFDYSHVVAQARRLVPRIKLFGYQDVIFELTDPTKEQITDIYRRFFGKTSVTSPDFTSSPGIALQNIYWLSEDHTVQVNLMPDKVEIRCTIAEPDYVTKLREYLSGTNVCLEIKIENG